MNPVRRLIDRLLPLVLLPALPVLLGTGCSALPTKAPGADSGTAVRAAGPAPAQDSRRQADLLVLPEPQWGPRGEPLDAGEPKRRSRSPGESASSRGSIGQELVTLRGQVAARCAGARVAGESDFLAALVTDLYLAGVEPALATEALILGDCGSLASVVRELVAQGGDPVVPQVIARALLLSGPGAEPIIESAASAGLDRHLASLGDPTGTNGTMPLVYAMAYFPSRAESPEFETANAINMLYNQATPGYGIYTFVLVGAGFAGQGAADQARYHELLRVIETYVLAGEPGTRGPNPESHVFLVAVHPERAGDGLAVQTGPELSDPLRRELARQLRRQGQAALAGRLETRPGPFLVSSPEPRLLPADPLARRLIVDLSGIGVEYMYAVVDAFDRPLAPDPRGRLQGLEPIRKRLLGLFQRMPAGEPDVTRKDAWVFRIGRSAGSASESAVNGAGASPGAPRARRP